MPQTENSVFSYISHYGRNILIQYKKYYYDVNFENTNTHNVTSSDVDVDTGTAGSKLVVLVLSPSSSSYKFF